MNGVALELWLDDVAHVEFMDSAGVHVLVKRQARPREPNRRLTVMCPAGHMPRRLEHAGVANQLPLSDDRVASHRAA